MGGKIFQDNQLVDYGIKLINTCLETVESSPASSSSQKGFQNPII